MRKDVLAELGAASLTAKTSHVPRCAAQRLTSEQAAADAAYTALLRGTLETAGGTAADDRAALRAGGLAPRARLALEFRTAQRVLLNAELAAAAASNSETSFLVHASVHVFPLVQYQLSLSAFLNQESWPTCSEPQAAYLMLRFMWREFITRAPGAGGRAPGASAAPARTRG